jgi:hypothetical protein
MSWVTAGDAIREREFQEWKRMREGAVAAEQQRLDRIARWGKALSVLPTDELTQLAQGWSSFTELVKPSAQRAIDIQQEEKR